MCAIKPLSGIQAERNEQKMSCLDHFCNIARWVCAKSTLQERQKHQTPMKPLAIHCRQFSLSDLFRRWLIKENVTGKPQKKINKHSEMKKKTQRLAVYLWEVKLIKWNFSMFSRKNSSQKTENFKHPYKLILVFNSLQHPTKFRPNLSDKFSSLAARTY